MHVHPVWLLLRLRASVAMRGSGRSSSALSGVALALLVFGPAALAAGEYCRTAFAALPAPRDEWLLGPLLTGLQAMWVLLLLPGAGLTLGQNPPTTLLRAFPIRPLQVVLASTLGNLLDVPLLLALPTFIAIITHFGRKSPGAMVVAITALGLIALQAAVLGPVLEQMGALLSRRRRAPLALALAVALILGMNIAVPSALRAATPQPGKEAKIIADAARQSVKTPPVSWIVLLPSGAAGRAIGAAERAEWGTATAALMELALYLVATAYGAGRLVAAVILREASPGGDSPRGRTWQESPRKLPSSHAPTAWESVRTVAAHEWRNLLRNPSAHTTLRLPANLILIIAYGWIAPNAGAYALVNTPDLLNMGALLYCLLWQMQFVCDRFGNESGTAALLFGFPLNRRLLLIGKNLALFAVLLLVDATVATGFCLLAGWRHLIVPVLCWLPAVLGVFTGLGNLVTVRSSFPLARRGETFAREPDRVLVFTYMVVGFGMWALLWPVAFLLGKIGLLAVPLGIVYIAGLYVASVWWSARQLAHQEITVVHALDETA